MVEFFCGVGGDDAGGGAAIHADIDLGVGDLGEEQAEQEESKHGDFFDSLKGTVTKRSFCILTEKLLEIV
jgi:hypothetical protein